MFFKQKNNFKKEGKVMKKLIKFLTILLCICFLLPVMACERTEKLSVTAAKLLEDRYTITMSSEKNYLNIELAAEVELLIATKTESNVTKKIVIVATDNESDLKIVYFEKGKIVSSYFKEKCFFRMKENMLIFGSSQDAFEDLKETDYSSEAQELIENLVKNKYLVTGNKTTTFRYDYYTKPMQNSPYITYLSAKKPYNEKIMIDSYIFSDKKDLNFCYEYIEETYEDDIEANNLVIKKKGKIMLISKTAEALKDALGK